MKFSLRSSLTLAALSWIGSSSQGHAQTAYALSNNGTTLIRFEIATPALVTTIGNFNGAITSVEGIDFRPSNGLLYGYQSGSDRLVTINLTDASTTLVSILSPAASGSTTGTLGVDFNPVPDRLRLVNVDDQNLRINVDTGATLVDGPLAYVAPDPAPGANPNIIDAAYTNSDNNPATGTALYYIDNTRDTLVTSGPGGPNSGQLVTVGPLNVNTTAYTGFDIFTDPFGSNVGYALLDSTGTGNAAALYNIDLATGAAMAVPGGALTGQTRVFGLAIAPVAAVPDGGATLALLGLGLLAVEGLRRKLSSGGVLA